MEILTSVRRLYISFKSLVNDFVYSFGRAALLSLVEVWNHTVPLRERRRIRVIRSTRSVRTRTNPVSNCPKQNWEYSILRDFGVPLWCKWDLRYFEIVRSVKSKESVDLNSKFYSSHLVKTLAAKYLDYKLVLLWKENKIRWNVFL